MSACKFPLPSLSPHRLVLVNNRINFIRSQLFCVSVSSHYWWLHLLTSTNTWNFAVFFRSVIREIIYDLYIQLEQSVLNFRYIYIVLTVDKVVGVCCCYCLRCRLAAVCMCIMWNYGPLFFWLICRSKRRWNTKLLDTYAYAQKKNTFRTVYGGSSVILW